MLQSSALAALTTERNCRLRDQFTQHQLLHRGPATIREFLCCRSDEMPSRTRVDQTQNVI